jgi:hypothetical protein
MENTPEGIIQKVEEDEKITTNDLERLCRSPFLLLYAFYF